MRPRYIVLLLLLLLFSTQGLAADDKRTAKEYPADSIQVLELANVPGEINISQSTDGKARIILDGKGKFLDAVDVALEGGVLRLEGKSAGGTTVVTTQSGSVTNIVIGGGTSKVTVGGKTIESTSEPMELQVTLELPSGVDFKGEVIDRLRSELQISNVDLQVAGVADVRMVGLKSKTLKVSIAGSSKFFAAGLADTDALVDAAGASSFQLRGSYTRLAVKLAGACEGRTYGNVQGDLIVDLSGACDMEHNGLVRGKLRDSLRGASDFRIFD